MASRDDILKAVRARPLPAAELPSLDQGWITYPDRRRQFAAVLESVGGRCVFVPTIEAANRTLNEDEVYRRSRRIVSCVPGIGTGNVDLNSISDPHELEDIDYAILAGHFGVAENGAVWITDEGIKHRAIFFIPQHLALVVPADQLLDNMHQAYQRLAFPQAGFGAFISGPSKTADIEQSLVIGAHGPRSLTVFLVGS